ncbi:hypothetical protein [Butyrivibrio sp. FC2001]|uniref:hypothetical protein n=1 Tax=Butyrivibrio sp. FC2001 TaxID=1280671 RepID=UPI00040A7F8C|nr:hypothetical protein [Butyrivibrio sp. FC2001]
MNNNRRQNNDPLIEQMIKAMKLADEKTMVTISFEEEDMADEGGQNLYLGPGGSTTET